MREAGGQQGEREVDRVEVHPRRWTILSFALLAQFLMAASVATVNVALPSIRDDMDASPAQIQWVIVLYQLSYAMLLITGGRLGDMFGRRRLFLLGSVGFVIASALAGLAPNVTVLVAARLIQGVAGGLASPQVLALIQVIFPLHERSKAIARFAMTSAASFTVGQLMTGALLRLDVFGLGWRAAFLVNVPPGIVAFVGAAILFPNPPVHRHQHLDMKGILLVSGGMVMVLYPLIQGRSAGWPALFFVIMAMCLPTCWAFVRHERARSVKDEDPLVDVRLFEAHSFNLGLLLSGVTQATFFPAFLFVTITLQSGFGLDPWTTAVTLTPTPIALVLSAYMSSRLIANLGRRLFAVSAVLMAASVIMLMMIFPGRTEAPSVWELMPAMILLGIGQGLAVPAMLNLALLDVPARHAGAASGVLQTIQQLTAAVGVAVLGLAFFEVLGTGTTPEAYVDAFRATMLVVLGLHASLFLLHFALPKHLDSHPTPELMDTATESL